MGDLRADFQRKPTFPRQRRNDVCWSFTDFPDTDAGKILLPGFKSEID
jgi:hypothetical protein